VCDLATVTEVLDSTPAFAALSQGVLAFGGRDGGVLWSELADVVAERWDDVLDALDALVRVPVVDVELAAKLRATATPAPAGDLDPDGNLTTWKIAGEFNIGNSPGEGIVLHDSGNVRFDNGDITAIHGVHDTFTSEDDPFCAALS